jgi:phosphonate degradation associated HDIG domain protein
MAHAATRYATPRWTGERERFADGLLDWMAKAGATHYDDAVTQFEHALQSALLAEARGGDDALVVAAFLHDVGHLLADEHDGHDDFLGRDLEHERIGASWLARAFGPAVTEPILLHVDAKRYLCAVDAGYRDGLSAASKRSLVVQGGPMSADEAAAFAARPGAAAAIEVRRIDDLAKVRGGAVAAAADIRRRLIGLMH